MARKPGLAIFPTFLALLAFVTGFAGIALILAVVAAAMLGHQQLVKRAVKRARNGR